MSNVDRFSGMMEHMGGDKDSPDVDGADDHSQDSGGEGKASFGGSSAVIAWVLRKKNNFCKISQLRKSLS